MERMTGFDASLLYLETPQQMLVIGGILFVDVSQLQGGYDFDRLRSEFTRRIKEIPELRRKIYDSPLNLGHPAWVEEYELDLDKHVRRVVVNDPGDEQAVFEMCGVLGSRPLDRSRPLWELWALEGLADPDTVALYFRASHAIFDGVNGADLLRKLGGDGNDPAARELVRVQAGGANAIQLVVGGAWDYYVRRPMAFARIVPDTLALPFRLRRGSKDEAQAPDPGVEVKGGRAAPFTAPRTRFNATITPHRAVAGATLDLSEIREIKDAFGVTVNDVLLSVVGGGLRRYLRFHDDLPDKPLVATVPVSTRAEDGTSGNNRVTVIFAALGTDIQDPVERLRTVSARTRRGKSKSKAILRPDFIQDLAKLAPSTLLSLGMKLYGDFHLADLHPVVHSLIVSNIPGPREEPDFLGARVTHMYPLGPVMHGAGLTVTAMSLGGNLDVGINACEHLVPDPELFAAGIHDSFAWLLERSREEIAGRSGGTGARGRKRTTTKKPSPEKAATRKTAAKKATAATKTTAKATARKTAAKKTATKATAKKTAAKKTAAKNTPAGKTPAKKTPASPTER